MKYEILYPEAFPVVECHLERGESIKAESDAMIAMSPTIDVEGKMDGGILSGLARKFLSGESMFFQELTARRGEEKLYSVMLCPAELWTWNLTVHTA